MKHTVHHIKVFIKSAVRLAFYLLAILLNGYFSGPKMLLLIHEASFSGVNENPKCGTALIKCDEPEPVARWITITVLLDPQHGNFIYYFVYRLHSALSQLPLAY
jgi:hypothetical protein